MKSRKIDELNEEGLDIKRRQQELTDRGKERHRRIQQAQQELKELDSAAGQQEKKLASHSPDSYKAWKWIQQNQGFFEKQVFGPAMIECSVKDSKWADMIESLFQKSNFIAFTVQTKNDFKKLNDQVHGAMHLSEINIRTMDAGIDAFQPPMEATQLERYGLSGWASDYLNGPEPLLAGLFYEVRLHLTAIGWPDTTPEQYDLLQASGLNNWVTSRSSYKITRRPEYGPSATSAQVRDVKKATIWTNQQADVGAKRELQENIDGWNEEIKAFEDKTGELQIQLLHIREQLDSTRQEHVRQALRSQAKSLTTFRIKCRERRQNAKRP